MPAPNQSTFDGNPNANPPTTAGYRPGADDFDGAQLENADNNFDPRYVPSAPRFNTDALTIVSCGRMIPWASISVTGGATPSIAFWRVAANQITGGSGTSGSPFTLTRNGAGDISITYSAALFPSPMGQPHATLNVQLGAHEYAIGALNISNGVRVTTVTDAALTDMNFTVDLF
jgi:hypothetical protein